MVKKKMQRKKKIGKMPTSTRALYHRRTGPQGQAMNKIVPRDRHLWKTSSALPEVAVSASLRG
jgi:hypothetical protein